MTYQHKILVVEDDPAVQELLQVNLERCGWKVSITSSGEEALLTVLDLNPDLILLDIMLPGVNGLQVCKQVRSYAKTSKIPIIMLSALGNEPDIIKGLEEGADDYIPKPFSPTLLQAKVSAVMRRTANGDNTPEQKLLYIHGMVIDPVRFMVKIGGADISLTRTDFMILHLLANEPGRVFTRRQIIIAGHGKDHEISDRSVDVQIVGLRRKIGSAGQCIETVRGVGYRMKEETGPKN